jgi:energy-coupling factor transporter ATP-binding protein EcfA2
LSRVFRGVALFGHSCSGKSTIASLLASLVPNSVHIEISADVLVPLMKAATLPKVKAPEELAELVRLHGRSNVDLAPLQRSEAQQMFLTLGEHYGFDIVARIAECLRQEKFAIISGARGHANLEWFRANGYLTACLVGAPEILLKRRCERDRITWAQAVQDQRVENDLYGTDSMSRISDVIVSTATQAPEDAARELGSNIEHRLCRRCVNSSLNPAIHFDQTGLCSVCQFFDRHYHPEQLSKELEFLLTLRDSSRSFDALVGLSGGKDSSAATLALQELGFSPRAFTIDSGYYPEHILTRSRAIAEDLGLAHVWIELRPFITRASLESYRLTADLYDLPESPTTSLLFRQLYTENRLQYSVRDDVPMPYVRTCQLCRKSVIRAYYGTAIQQGVRLVVLGMNEWTGLCATALDRAQTLSALRKLQPSPTSPPVFVVHLPFLLRIVLADTEKRLNSIGWTRPEGEDLVETGRNSCLLARAAEDKVTRLLGFNPDSTRLSREVTVGFLSRDHALRALSKTAASARTVRVVLERAGIL